MAKRYPAYVHEWFNSHELSGMSSGEIRDLLEKETGFILTMEQVQRYKKNHRITTGYIYKARKKKFTEEQIEFVRSLWAVEGHKIAELVNVRFGTSFSYDEIRAMKHRERIDNGYDARYKEGHKPDKPFPKGRVPDNAFKSGNVPHNRVPIGTLSTRGGETYIKTKDGCGMKNWLLYERYVYEKYNGPIGSGEMVCFKDGDKTNFDPENLAAVKRAEHVVMNLTGIRKDAKNFELSLLYAKVCIERAKRIKERRENDVGV